MAIVRSTFWSRIRVALWLFILVFCIMVLFTRIVVVFLSKPDGSEIVYILLYFALLYALFFFEGLRVCAIQISDLEQDALDNYVSQVDRRGIIKPYVNDIRAHYEKFMNGRQIIALSIIAALAMLVESTQNSFESYNNTFYSIFQNIFQIKGGEWDEMVFNVINSSFLNFILAALVPGWFGQMLPELVADKRCIRFLRSPMARLSVKLAFVTAAIGIDSPIRELFGDWFRQRIQPEEIGHGDAAAFERLSAVLGVSIGERTIKITAAENELDIIDASQLDYIKTPYAQRTSVVRHMIRVPLSRGQAKTWRGTVTTPKASDIIYSQNNPKVIRQKLFDANDNKEVSQELLLHGEAVLEEAIPRDGMATDSVIVKFHYACDALPLDENITEQFCFDVTKPTKIVEIDIEVNGAHFIVEPRPKILMIDDIATIGEGELNDLRSTHSVKKPEGKQGWSIVIRYPPLGSRIIIPLDARPGAPGRESPRSAMQSAIEKKRWWTQLFG